MSEKISLDSSESGAINLAPNMVCRTTMGVDSEY